MRVGLEQLQLTYFRPRSGVIEINHVYTPPGLRGRGLARVLVERAVTDARDEGAQVDPVCPYTAALFDRREDWRALRV